jgi:hypothetical protein
VAHSVFGNGKPEGREDDVRAISLLYHDVVLPGRQSSSGFPGGDADIYKLTLPDFERHPDAIRSALPKPAIIASELGDIDISHTRPLLTFDDGGVSAHQHVARLLETVGWRGHFFVTTNWIGKEGFLNPAQIRDLHARGHSIGSHSYSHPARMSYCSREQLRREWTESIAVVGPLPSAIPAIRILEHQEAPKDRRRQLLDSNAKVGPGSIELPCV